MGFLMTGPRPGPLYPPPANVGFPASTSPPHQSPPIYTEEYTEPYPLMMSGVIDPYSYAETVALRESAFDSNPIEAYRHYFDPKSWW